MSVVLHQHAAGSAGPELEGARSLQQLADLVQRTLGCEAAVVSMLPNEDTDPAGHRPGTYGRSAAAYRSGFKAVGKAALDAATLAHPLYAAAQGMRFYAGLPLHGHDGQRIGVLAAVDQNERVLARDELETLKLLAGMAADIEALGEAEKAG